jgi:hypothetical protein
MGQPRAGVVSLIVLPRSSSRPTPSRNLLSRIRDELRAHHSPVLDLVVIGPDYVQVHIEAAIVIRSLDIFARVETAIRTALSRFLDPVLGGSGFARMGFRPRTT